MQLTTIGTGTAAPQPERVQSGSLIEAGGVRLVVDCGSGVLWRMAQLGIDWTGITHVAVTHFHADHSADLVGLMVAWRYGMLPPRATPVTLIGPPGFPAFVDRLAAAFLPELRTMLPLAQLAELTPGGTLSLGDEVILESCKVPHTAESVAYGVRADGHRIVCSGDTGFDLPFAQWARDADLLLLECSLPQSLAIPMHLTPEQCGEVAAVAAPRHLVLNHFYPPVLAQDVAGIVGTRFGGRVSLAHDGACFPAL